MGSGISRLVLVLVASVLGGSGTAARAGFLDVVALNGLTFGGYLDGITVIGRSRDGFSFAGNAYNDSTIDGTSPQYSYNTVYDPAAPAVDRIGYGWPQPPGSAIGAPITLTFSAPVTNPRFEVANLTSGQFTFELTNGLTSLSLIRGNGGNGDGLQVVGNVVTDANPATVVNLDPSTPPPMTGARSAYGTISLNGTFTSVSLSFDTTLGGGGGGSFTLSTVPEPTAMALTALAAPALLRRRRAAS